jgi:hypothetical protein
LLLGCHLLSWLNRRIADDKRYIRTLPSLYDGKSDVKKRCKQKRFDVDGDRDTLCEHRKLHCDLRVRGKIKESIEISEMEFNCVMEEMRKCLSVKTPSVMIVFHWGTFSCYVTLNSFNRVLDENVFKGG